MGHTSGQEVMTFHTSPVVSNTKAWALSLLAEVMPHQPDAYSYVNVHVEENGGQLYMAQSMSSRMLCEGCWSRAGCREINLRLH